MTRAEYSSWNTFFINAGNDQGLITGQRHRNMNDVQRQYIDESLPFQTTILFNADEEYWYIKDDRLTGKIVIRVTGRTFVKISTDLEAVGGEPDEWKFIDGSEYEEGAAVVIDFYEP